MTPEAPVADDRYEPNRFLGMPVGPSPGARPGPRGREPQRVMGFPVDWFGPAGRDRLQPVAHPVRTYRRWLRRRRLGPFAVDADETAQNR